MTAGDAMVLIAAGIGAGLTGSIAGLASLISYPTLLALGLAPVTANVTNTVALVFSSAGSVIGSRPELRGQAALVVRLAAAGSAGGLLGGLLLLVTPAGAFERLVPWLILVASLAIMVRRRLVVAAETCHPGDRVPARRGGRGLALAVAGIGVYGGYFGAGAGVMLLALLLFVTGDALPLVNGVKNAVLGCANAVAAVVFAFFGDVRWTVVVPLGAGLLIGGRLGPIVVRRAPANALRIVIGLAGLGLAVTLAIDAYARPSPR